MNQETQSPRNKEFDLFNQKAIIESLIFAANEPISTELIARCTGIMARTVDNVVEDLNVEYQATGRSFRIEKVNGGYRFYSLPEYHQYVARAGEITKKIHLSQASLETLAVIAYRQPITRAEIERIRGVDCDGVLRNLMARDLIAIDGRSSGPGRPHLFVTTDYFLEYFGLPSLSHLPPLPQAEDVSSKLPTLKLHRKAESITVPGNGDGNDSAVEVIEIDKGNSGDAPCDLEVSEIRTDL